jgi:hypothetical protein
LVIVTFGDRKTTFFSNQALQRKSSKVGELTSARRPKVAPARRFNFGEATQPTRFWVFHERAKITPQQVYDFGFLPKMIFG